ncbi:MAG: sugar ABC transporter ATP-binding protein [Clostridiales Family XIII bacterium]|jgi:ribose transport system ATP-binding protein|nr:sugar ABC transporter ATP-binding protein [Clostridiales Family XIII bacterium]
MAGEIILKTEKLCKTFGPTKANIDVDFELRRGEVHGLVGENGSGKSTLLSQIAGIIGSDSGRIELQGEVYEPHSPLDAYDHGIGIVVQELGVIGNVPAGVNVFIGRTQRFTKFGIVNTTKINEEVREIAKEWDLGDLPLNKLAGAMNVESRKQVELLRALAVDPEILILDEITQALSYDNRRRLYAIIEKFKAMGRSILMISHDLEEIMATCDRLTVLRDGRVVDTVETSAISMNDLKRMMVGREMEGEYYRVDNEPSRRESIALSVENLSVTDEVKDMSFDIYDGEIVGFCGLSGSGIHTIGKALYGLSDEAKGKVRLRKNEALIDSSQKALHEGMAYVPKERDWEGLMMQANIRDNITLPGLDDLKSKAGFVWNGALNKTANKAVSEFSVKCNSIAQEMGGLSGGNKQKVNLGRWIAKDLSCLVLDCPTRGVDVGAKAYIYNLLKSLKADGLGMILISDELMEVLGMADRIFVVKDGEIARELKRGDEFTEDNIIEVML